MIKRIMLIICDRCSAEGPSVDGENRGPLMREAARYGWQVIDGRHVCGECLKPKPESPIRGVVPGPTNATAEDRSRHWTEARKEKP